MHKGLVIGLLFLLLASCTGDRKVQEMLDRVKGYMNVEEMIKLGWIIKF